MAKKVAKKIVKKVKEVKVLKIVKPAKKVIVEQFVSPRLVAKMEAEGYKEAKLDDNSFSSLDVQTSKLSYLKAIANGTLVYMKKEV